MNPLKAYRTSREREQDAFERSELGGMARDIYNAQFSGAVCCISPAFLASLAAEAAFGRSYPAFYAGGALRLW